MMGRNMQPAIDAAVLGLEGFVSVVTVVIDNVDLLIDGVILLATVITGRLVAALAAKTAGMLATAGSLSLLNAALLAATIQTQALAVASRTATAAYALMGGPIGVVALALGGAGIFGTGIEQWVVNTLLAQTPSTLYASELTRFELRRGACLRADPEPLWSKIREVILPLVQWLPVDEAISLRAGELSARLRGQDRDIGVVDTLLAATAEPRGLVMVTRNLRHFQGIDGLKLENWFDPRP
ncbi:MAG: type II toxin-antitoxin system VapC family toxin [Wenzhouxiangella sp.]|nr:type II toxin-antitoxin system VapC family toxin [Wenzhouxiangella sp.]